MKNLIMSQLFTKKSQDQRNKRGCIVYSSQCKQIINTKTAINVNDR
jgi:hypothetical protein